MHARVLPIQGLLSFELSRSIKAKTKFAHRVCDATSLDLVSSDPDIEKLQDGRAMMSALCESLGSPTAYKPTAMVPASQ